MQKANQKKIDNNSKSPNTVDPQVAKLTKKLIKKYSEVWKELAKL